MRSDAIERVHRALEEIAAGKMVVMVDDEERENEGDLVMAADLVTADAINFMARFGRGLICMPLPPERVAALQLPMMNEAQTGQRSTAFTVSIEAASGVTTGISAADRAHTVRVAVDSKTTARDISSPGHIFPLRAAAGGVLQRAGHTEGAVDIARLSGRAAAGVICEIMKEDGTMARMPDLQVFAREHGLQILSIADLIQYRLQTERLVKKVRETPLQLNGSSAPWRAHVFETAASSGQNQMLALTLGEIDESPVLVRVQVGQTFSDVFGARLPTRVTVTEAMRKMEAEGRGVLLYIPSRSDVLSELDTLVGAAGRRVPSETVLRETGFGSQVLNELGVRKLRLLTKHQSRVVAVAGFDLEVVEQVFVGTEESPI